MFVLSSTYEGEGDLFSLPSKGKGEGKSNEPGEEEF